MASFQFFFLRQMYPTLIRASEFWGSRVRTRWNQLSASSVSYTHLTLPTKA